MSTPVLSFRGEFAPGTVGVDLDRLIASRLLIQANSGGGKSRLLRSMCEQMHGRVQLLVIDPEGEFASLRERFDYLLAGKEGDVPAEPKTAKLLARKLVELGVSAVVDLYDLRLPERRQFVRIFLDELMHLPRTLWRPLIVALDEAHVFAPERGAGDAESTGAVITLCTQGRKRGYCAVLSTQRISKLHKDAAAELANKLVGQTSLDVDMRRAGDDLGFDKDQRLTLRQLEPGEFYAFGPAISREVLHVRSAPVTTTHPQPGAVAPPPPPAPAAIRKLALQLQDMPAQAAEEVRTLEQAQQRIRALEAEKRKLERAGPLPNKDVIAAAVTQAVVDSERRLRREFDVAQRESREVERQLRRQIDVLATRIHHARDGITAQMEKWLRNGDGPPAVQNIVQNGAIAPPPREVRAHTPTMAASPSPSATPGPRPPRARTDVARYAPAKLLAAQQRILDALATYAAFGQDEAPVAGVAALAGYKVAGHFNNTRGQLRTAGLIEYGAGATMLLTDAGRAVAHAPELTTLEDVHEAWLTICDGAQRKLLEVLIDAWPDALTTEDLASRAGYEVAGHFNNTRGKLRTMGAVEYPKRGQVRASDLLFPEALRDDRRSLTLFH